MPEHQFTKVYKKVKADKNLNELQKLILSEDNKLPIARTLFLYD